MGGRKRQEVDPKTNKFISVIACVSTEYSEEAMWLMFVPFKTAPG